MMPRPWKEPAIVARALLPSSAQTQLLRALLLTDEEGQLAWLRWQALVGDPPAYFAVEKVGHKRLLPLLYSARKRHGFEPSGTVTTWLRSAYAREKLRSTVYLQGSHQALAALVAAAVPVIALKGAALAEQVYGDWALRHCHDLDLLIETRALAQARAALQDAAFSVVPATNATSTVMLRHASGLLVLLHTRLFDHPHYCLPFAQAWERSQLIDIGGVAVRALSPADSLLHVCGHASCSPARATLLWACDAWQIIARTPDLDWELLVRSSVGGQLQLPIALYLGYLQAYLGAPVPSGVLARLHRSLQRWNTAGYEAALYGMALGARTSLRYASGRGMDWRSRVALLKWALLPSPVYVPLLAHTSCRRVLPAWSVYRLLGMARRHA